MQRGRNKGWFHRPGWVVRVEMSRKGFKALRFLNRRVKGLGFRVQGSGFRAFLSFVGDIWHLIASLLKTSK